jgi:hypothetical protein
MNPYGEHVDGGGKVVSIFQPFRPVLIEQAVRRSNLCPLKNIVHVRRFLAVFSLHEREDQREIVHKRMGRT